MIQEEGGPCTGAFDSNEQGRGEALRNWVHIWLMVGSLTQSVKKDTCYNKNGRWLYTSSHQENTETKCA